MTRDPPIPPRETIEARHRNMHSRSAYAIEA
jgi:hypothetical protein